jgi:hypothetical protein
MLLHIVWSICYLNNINFLEEEEEEEEEEREREREREKESYYRSLYKEKYIHNYNNFW